MQIIRKTCRQLLTRNLEEWTVSKELAEERNAWKLFIKNSFVHASVENIQLNMVYQKYTDVCTVWTEDSVRVCFGTSWLILSLLPDAHFMFLSIMYVKVFRWSCQYHTGSTLLRVHFHQKLFERFQNLLTGVIGDGFSRHARDTIRFSTAVFYVHLNKYLCIY